LARAARSSMAGGGAAPKVTTRSIEPVHSHCHPGPPASMVLSRYSEDYQDSTIEDGDPGWQWECTGSIERVVTFGAAPPPAIDDLAARAKSGKVQLTWTPTDVASYNVYRGTTPGGPYSFLATATTTYATYLDLAVINGVTYYYVVRPMAQNAAELDQSNEASATPLARTRSR